MYCPSCGASYEQKINYCKKCSAQKAQNELQAQTQAALPPQTAQPVAVGVVPERLASVTEHTTRSFKPSPYSGPGAQE